MELLDLVDEFRTYLDSKKEQLKAFSKYEVQVEGWLKGELLTFLDKEVGGIIVNFEKEVKIPNSTKRKKIDLRLTLSKNENNDTWIELKHWHIGYQKGVKYNVSGYFTDPGNIIKDIEKLQKVNGEKFLLVLSTPKPSSKEWNDGIDKFSRKYNFGIKSLTDPSNYPDHYFLGLIAIKNN